MYVVPSVWNWKLGFRAILSSGFLDSSLIGQLIQMIRWSIWGQTVYLWIQARPEVNLRDIRKYNKRIIITINTELSLTYFTKVMSSVWENFPFLHLCHFDIKVIYAM